MSEAACFCGMDSSATCQGPCGRRICSKHAVQWNSLIGYMSPKDALLREFHHVEVVAKLGYARAAGAMCPQCRALDQDEAWSAVPRIDTDDPVERRVQQFRYYGRYERLPYSEPDLAAFGRSWVEAAKRRGIATDKTEDGRRIWSFTVMQSDGPSYSGPGSTWSQQVIAIDESGMSPIHVSTSRRGVLKKKYDLVMNWEPGPKSFPFGGKPGDSHLKLMMDRLLVGEPHPNYLVPNEDTSQVPPRELYRWLTDRNVPG